MDTGLMAAVIGAVGLVFAILLFRMDQVPPGRYGENDRPSLVSIHDGAMVFLKREYSILVIFIVVVFALLAWRIELNTGFAFLGGAFCSMLAGFIGMKAATAANVRTCAAAKDKGQPAALSVAFSGGAVMGMTVASLGLIGVGVVFWFFGGDPETAGTINGFAMGASSIALFARVGGGIYTKAADVGADLVGKVEAGIPEDDPRNPAVIADNVGDNVGDTAGMGRRFVRVLRRLRYRHHRYCGHRYRSFRDSRRNHGQPGSLHAASSAHRGFRRPGFDSRRPVGSPLLEDEPGGYACGW